MSTLKPGLSLLYIRHLTHCSVASYQHEGNFATLLSLNYNVHVYIRYMNVRGQTDKITVYLINKYNSHKAVPFMWGSLRLARINYFPLLCLIKYFPLHYSLCLDGPPKVCANCCTQSVFFLPRDSKVPSPDQWLVFSLHT